MNVLRSHRLELVSMGPALLEALLAGDHASAAQIGGFRIPDDLILRKRTIQMRLRQIQANPEAQPWLLRAMVVRQSRMMCGYIGFHSEPGPEDLSHVAADGVELGYAVGESFRRQGFAKEAAITLMRWAFECHGQRSFVLSIAPDNEASLAMAHSMGFCEIGSHMDQEDGIELYFERRLDRWPDEWGWAKMMEVQTERLRLLPLSLNQLRCYVAVPEVLERELGFEVSRDIVTDRLCRAIEMKLSKMERVDPSEHAWYTYWLIIIKDRTYGAGLAGFKGLPDEQGKTEIGYGMDPAHRGRGYMTEAVKGLIAWAFQDARCRTVIAPDTPRWNVASHRVLEKVGMRVYHETEEALDWRVDKPV